MKNKLLIHACCAPCLVAVEDYIKENIKDLTVQEYDIMWYNQNIHPMEEYYRRRDTLEQYVKTLGKKLIIDDTYDMIDFMKDGLKWQEMGYESRCEYCYEVRLDKVFKYAKRNGYSHVTTTLYISPYQNHELLKKVANDTAKLYEVENMYKDFRPLFREGQQKANELGLYRQKYCGCMFSIDEAYMQKKNRKNKNKNDK